jgi:DNA polymerase bacteriophage-type
LTSFGAKETRNLFMASQIYGIPLASMSKQSHPRERQLGKLACLGLSYGMGAERFQRTCAKEGVNISFEEAERIKRVYRATNCEIVRLWTGLESAAVDAVTHPGAWVSAADGRIGFLKERDWLYLRLPSGRLLTYAKPKYGPAETRFGAQMALIFEGISSITHRWELQTLYGGKLTENAVQAICRDLLASALLRLEAVGYPIVLHVHDEILAEVPEGTGDIRAFERLMCEAPDWARGFPIKAEGWRGKRFRK